MKENRYIRQTLLDAIGENGQSKLLAAHVVVIGCGGLGSIAAPYLAGAGIGKLTLVDGDRPDISNLHRQVFFSETNTRFTKAEVLAEHISKLNSEISISVVSSMITKATLPAIVQDVSLVLECTDNIQVKYMVNDYCALKHIPMVYGAIHKYDGYASFFENKDASSIHLRDIFAEPNTDIPSCSEVGVMGALAGVIGLLQANEAIKFIAGAGTNLRGQLLTYNILTNDQLKLRLKKTFTRAMNDVFEQSTYISEQVCATYETTMEQVLSNREAYDLISILEDHEHENIDDVVERQPLSQWDLNAWKPTEKQTVFYCMSGVRSSKLVNEILLHHPNAKVLSLHGGLKAHQNRMKTL